MTQETESLYDQFLPVYIEWPRCPLCRSRKIKTQRSIQQGDGSVLRLCICCDPDEPECKTRFKVVVE